MTTSNGPILTRTRVPLRLRMTQHPGRDQLDGGWWPQSRDLGVELADLVEHFPTELGRIVRAVYSPPDWDPGPRRIPTTSGYVKVGSFPRDDTHIVHLKTSDRAVLRVLVVPEGLSAGQGEEALLAAATRGNAESAASLLATVTEFPDVDPWDHWHADGGSGWDSDVTAPSLPGGS
jgi:hypothetical protein